MKYVDGFVLPVPKKNLGKYRRMAKAAGKVWKKHGALEYFECAGDDLYPKMKGRAITRFPKTDETVVFSFIVYKSRAHRDSVNKKVMAEIMSNPRNKDMQMPFDVKRMAYDGFRTIVNE